LDSFCALSLSKGKSDQKSKTKSKPKSKYFKIMQAARKKLQV
jgi:hypothetical protein